MMTTDNGAGRFRSRLGFGASGLGNLGREVSDAEAQATLEAGFNAGMHYFDTAPLYGHGLSELRLGRFLRGLPRDAFVVSTKVGRYLVPPRGAVVNDGIWVKPLPLKPVYDYGYDGTMRSLEQSASRLGLERFDVVYIHDADRFNHGADFERRFDEAMEGCYRALDELRQGGHVGAIGVGVNEGDIAARFVAAGRFDAVMMAGRYTLLDQGALDTLMPAALAKGVDVVAAGIFNSGILAKISDPSATLTYDYAEADAETVRCARRIAEICAGHGVPFQAAAVQFPLAHPAVRSAVIGMSRPERVAQNVGWSRTAIPNALWAELKAEGLLHASAPTPDEAA